MGKRKCGGAAFFLIIIFFCGNCFANNIAVDNGSLEDQVALNDTYDIEFDISWDNSWYTAGAPSAVANWDAAWVFAKHSVYSGGDWGDWAHCTLLDTGAVVASGSTVDFSDNESDGVYRGVFVRRNASGAGTNTWTNMKVRWHYGASSVADDAVVRIKIFAIEMVHVPEGNFYIGDTDSDNTGNFKWEDGTAGAPQITSALGNAIDTTSNSYDDAQLEDENPPGDSGQGIRIDGDGGLDEDADGNIDHANFPTGYKAFYIMKYEVTQGQYVDFLNTLNGTQQSNRASADTAGNFLNDDDSTNSPTNRGGMKCRVAPSGATAGIYGNDLNDDDTYGGASDGEWIAANWLSWGDGVAYADWAALRPFTELEFTKAARGGQTAVDDEYACGGSNTADLEYTLSNSGAANEAIATNYEADPECNMMHSTTDGAIGGPLRSGIFADIATDDSTRAEAGMAYTGAMELSGNLWERTVTVGHSTGRDFEGTHGDGTLVIDVGSSYDGNATNIDWPGISGTPAQGVTGAAGSGFRGGTWAVVASSSRVSDRSYAAVGQTSRYYNRGIRCARTP